MWGARAWYHTTKWLLAAAAISWSQTAVAGEQHVDGPPTQVGSLPRVVALAQDNAPQVAIGRSRLSSSRSSLVGARLFPMQNPYFELTVNRTARGNPNDTTLFLGSAWLPFEISGQRSHRISQAEAFVGMHEKEVQQARAEACGAAILAWGRAVVETERIRTLLEIANSAHSEARAFRARRDVGDATERDTQLAEVELARHLVLIEEAKVTLSEALGELKRLTGREWNVPQQEHVRPDYNLNRLSPSQAASQSPYVRTFRSEADYHARTDDRLASEATGPVSLMLAGGHGTLGETVFGGGIAWALPTLRKNQGERAQAQAERERALTQSDVARKDIETRLTTILKEVRGLRQAQSVLDNQALPAARAARRAAEQMFEMGKIDILAVLVSRRDEAVLRLKQLDLAQRQWELMAAWGELTGAVP
jgi:outer membrane protein, heavy metal efflux system